jgi:hypothetical protein
MIPAGEGYVVIVGSIAGRNDGTVVSDSVDNAVYTMSTGAVHALNCVAPGATAVPATAHITFAQSAYPPEGAPWLLPDAGVVNDHFLRRE